MAINEKVNYDKKISTFFRGTEFEDPMMGLRSGISLQQHTHALIYIEKMFREMSDRIDELEGEVKKAQSKSAPAKSRSTSKSASTKKTAATKDSDEDAAEDE